MVLFCVPVLEVYDSQGLCLKDVDFVVVKQIFQYFLTALVHKPRADLEHKPDQLLRQLPIGIFQHGISVDFPVLGRHNSLALFFDIGLFFDKFSIGYDGHGIEDIVRGGGGGVCGEEEGGLGSVGCDGGDSLVVFEGVELLLEGGHC